MMLLVFHCHGAAAQCAFSIENAIRSGWGKKNVSYAVEGDRLTIKAADGAINDADSIYIGSVKGCRTLAITVSQVSGDFPWGGKAVGFSFSSDKLGGQQWGNEAAFPPPRGRAMEAGFIKPPLPGGTELVYDIRNSAETTHIGAKVFIGNNVAIELRISAQAEPRAQTAVRAPKPSITNPGNISRPFRQVMSCSANCHQPRGGYGAAHADCPRDDGEVAANVDDDGDWQYAIAPPFARAGRSRH